MKRLIKKIVPSFVLSWYHLVLAFLGAVVFGFPSRKLRVVGVTGTKGKSTTIEMIDRILEEAGFRVASISSVRFKIGKKSWRNDLKMTMPGRLKIHHFIRRAVRAGCDYVILEVTSEGILQHRHRFIEFNTAVFTNLSPEHIERHGSFENYRRAKTRLFRVVRGSHVVNIDDGNSPYFLKFSADKKVGVSLSGNSLDMGDISFYVKPERVEISSRGSSFEIRGTRINLNLIGRFNVENALLAIGVAFCEGVDVGIVKKALEKIKKIPGRMEVVIGEPFKVIVDYAHTSDSLEKVYKAAKKLKTDSSKLICVLGATGGGRDKWKRPEIGKTAGEHCDKIIFTNEDPYDEDPLKIIKEVARGALRESETVEEREEAIKEAVRMAGIGDVIVITGKGSEPWMCVRDGKKIPWDDREIVREEFKKRENETI